MIPARSGVRGATLIPSQTFLLADSTTSTCSLSSRALIISHICAVLMRLHPVHVYLQNVIPLRALQLGWRRSARLSQAHVSVRRNINGHIPHRDCVVLCSTGPDTPPRDYQLTALYIRPHPFESQALAPSSASLLPRSARPAAIVLAQLTRAATFTDAPSEAPNSWLSPLQSLIDWHSFNLDYPLSASAFCRQRAGKPARAHGVLGAQQTSIYGG